LDSGENQVFDIDGILSSYYDCSDTDDTTDTDESNDTTDTDETETDDDETDDAATDTGDAVAAATTDHDPEFEIIDELAN
jgi:hypothetical protein